MTSLSLSLSCIGEGKGNPLQCSCLENPRDGGAWWAAIYEVAQSWRRLKRLSSSSSTKAVHSLLWKDAHNHRKRRSEYHPPSSGPKHCSSGGSPITLGRAPLGETSLITVPSYAPPSLSPPRGTRKTAHWCSLWTPGPTSTKLVRLWRSSIPPTVRLRVYVRQCYFLSLSHPQLIPQVCSLLGSLVGSCCITQGAQPGTL